MPALRWGFSYDASGNTANDSTIAYTWDGESQLKTAAGVTYSYDGDGRRVAKVGSKLYWYGSGGEILGETDGVGNTLNEYIFFGGQRVAMLPMNATPDGSIEQGLTYWTDGTPVQIVTDPAGAHSGNNYLQITTSAPGYTSHSRQFIPVSPGETIAFGGWAYRTSGATGAVRWKLAALDANKNSVASASPSPSDVSSATWTDQVGTYTVPAGVAYVYLYAEVYLPTATTVARFDDGFVTTSPLYYVEDSLGSSRVTTRSNGVVCYDADFYPYGGERPYTNGCIENNYKFEGKERDAETGNDDFGARYYSNRFGRWLSSDWSAVPVAVPYANLTNPQTLNLYSMVSDDPESFADLDGHDPAYDKPVPRCSTGCISQEDKRDQEPPRAENQSQTQTKHLSASDVSKAIKTYDSDKEDKNPGRVVKALDTMGKDFTVSGNTLRAGIKDSGVELPKDADKVLANVDSITRTGDKVVITNENSMTIKVGGQLAKTISFTINESVKGKSGYQGPALQNLKGVGIGLGPFAYHPDHWGPE